MNINKSSERKWLRTKKARSRRYLAETIIDTDYVDNPVLAYKYLLHSPEQVARGIGLHVNSDKIEFMSFKQDGVILTWNGKPLKLVDLFTYLGSNISSTEGNVNLCIGWLVVWILWHINLCRLFNVKSIFIQIISSISNNSIQHKYTV